MEKCQCYIHSLKQGENHVLGEVPFSPLLPGLVLRNL